MSRTAPTAVIGFDLGHGETALAIADPSSDAKPNVIDFSGVKQHITAVAQLGDGQVLIGDSALRERNPMRLYVAFKSAALKDPETRKPMRMLVEGIVADLVRLGKIKSASEVSWYFGAPSGWSREQYGEYEKLLVEAGLSQPTVVPESRAALLYARDSGEVRIRDRRIAQGVLIVDIGSSTTDYTFVRDLAESPVDHGNVALGASLIDREIMRWVIDGHEHRADIQEQIAMDPHTGRQLEVVCRRSKEDYFRESRENLERLGQMAGRVDVLDLAGGQKVIFDARMSPADMDAVLAAPLPALGNRSWHQAFRDDVAKALAEAGNSVDLVLLTGGPSRMPFVMQTCRELVGAERVALGNEPEVAIARGLALAGRMTIRGAGFRADVDKVKPKIRPLVEAKIPELAQAMAEAVAIGMTERHVIPAFVAWRNMQIATLDDMVTRIVSGIGADVDPARNRVVTEVTTAWQNRVRAELDNLTRPVCTRWYIDPGALKLPSIAVRTGGATTVKVNTTVATGNLDSAANAINAVVATVVATTLFGAGVALIVTGPGAVILAFVAAMGLLTVGKEKMMEKVQSANLPKVARQMKGEAAMTAKLRASAATGEAELAGELAAKFEEEFRAGLLGQVSTDIAAQLDSAADQAELLIR